MKINRQALVTHIKKISCDKQIDGVIFTGAFQASALKENHLLAVVAPGLDKVEPLPEDIGIPDLEKFIKYLGALAGSGNEALMVELRVEKHRLIIDEAERGKHELLIASPSTINTKLDPKTLKKLLDKAPKGTEGIPLTQTMIDFILSTYSLSGAEEVELFLGPDGGEVVVGNENANMHRFPLPDFIADEEYSLLFGPELVGVLKNIVNFSEAFILVSGPGSFINLKDGDYQYIMSPRAKAAE